MTEQSRRLTVAEVVALGTRMIVQPEDFTGDKGSAEISMDVPIRTLSPRPPRPEVPAAEVARTLVVVLSLVVALQCFILADVAVARHGEAAHEFYTWLGFVALFYLGWAGWRLVRGWR